MTRAARTSYLIFFVLSQAGCASTGRLREYDFRDRSVAVVAIVPPRPYVDTGSDVDLTGRSAVGALLKIGTTVYRESQAGKLRARLDSASVGIDLADRIAGGVLERSARYLGANAIESSRDADFHIEVQVEEYGVDARQWENGAWFHLKARLLLLDRDGRQVWEGRVDQNEQVTTSWFNVGSAGADIVTGSALGQLTVEEVTLALNAIADHSAFRLTEKLREVLEKARGD